MTSFYFFPLDCSVLCWYLPWIEWSQCPWWSALRKVVQSPDLCRNRFVHWNHPLYCTWIHCLEPKNKKREWFFPSESCNGVWVNKFLKRHWKYICTCFVEATTNTYWLINLKFITNILCQYNARIYSNTNLRKFPTSLCLYLSEKKKMHWKQANLRVRICGGHFNNFTSNWKTFYDALAVGGRVELGRDKVSIHVDVYCCGSSFLGRASIFCQ